MLAKIIVMVVFSLGCFFYALGEAHALEGYGNETYYSDKHCVEILQGAPTTLLSGIKPDCITETAVMEYDWAKRPKHYECIGQAIIYAAESGNQPACILLARTQKEFDFGIATRDAMALAGVFLMVVMVDPLPD